MKKLLIIGFTVVCIIFSFSVGTSFAGWLYTVDLVKVQAGPSGVVVAVKKADSTVVQKFIDSTNENTLLAIALTAQSLAAKVHVYYEPSANTFTEIVLSTE